MEKATMFLMYVYPNFVSCADILGYLLPISKRVGSSYNLMWYTKGQKNVKVKTIFHVSLIF